MQLRKITIITENYGIDKGTHFRDVRDTLVNINNIDRIDILQETDHRPVHFFIHFSGKGEHDAIMTNEEGFRSLTRPDSLAEESVLEENFLNGHKCS